MFRVKRYLSNIIPPDLIKSRSNSYPETIFIKGKYFSRVKLSDLCHSREQTYDELLKKDETWRLFLSEPNYSFLSDLTGFMSAAVIA